jgi:hypothetical protein
VKIGHQSSIDAFFLFLKSLPYAIFNRLQTPKPAILSPEKPQKLPIKHPFSQKPDKNAVETAWHTD